MPVMPSPSSTWNWTPPPAKQARRLSHGADAAQRGGVELDDPVVDVLLSGVVEAAVCAGGGSRALDRPIGHAGVGRGSSARDVLKPERRDQRRRARRRPSRWRASSGSIRSLRWINAGPISRGFPNSQS